MLKATPPILSLADVRVSLTGNAGRVDILRGIDLEARPGEALGIIGPSGSGKTTLLLAIAGLERITSGKITVAGHDLATMSEDQLAIFRRDNLGIIFQAFHLIPAMTALENVAVPLEFKGARDAFATAADRLTRVGLGHRLDHYPGELSGGEQQRVAIARALAAGARVILADEPTGNLDQETGHEIVELLFSLRAEHGVTLLLVTHDPELAQRCDRIAEIRDGRMLHREVA